MSYRNNNNNKEYFTKYDDLTYYGMSSSRKWQVDKSPLYWQGNQNVGTHWSRPIGPPSFRNTANNYPGSYNREPELYYRSGGNVLNSTTNYKQVDGNKPPCAVKVACNKNEKLLCAIDDKEQKGPRENALTEKASQIIDDILSGGTGKEVLECNSIHNGLNDDLSSPDTGASLLEKVETLRREFGEKRAQLFKDKEDAEKKREKHAEESLMFKVNLLSGQSKIKGYLNGVPSTGLSVYSKPVLICTTVLSNSGSPQTLYSNCTFSSGHSNSVLTKNKNDHVVISSSIKSGSAIDTVAKSTNQHTSYISAKHSTVNSLVSAASVNVNSVNLPSSTCLITNSDVNSFLANSPTGITDTNILHSPSVFKLPIHRKTDSANLANLLNSRSRKDKLAVAKILENHKQRLPSRPRLGTKTIISEDDLLDIDLLDIPDQVKQEISVLLDDDNLWSMLSEGWNSSEVCITETTLAEQSVFSNSNISCLTNEYCIAQPVSNYCASDSQARNKKSLSYLPTSDSSSFSHSFTMPNSKEKVNTSAASNYIEDLDSDSVLTGFDILPDSVAISRALARLNESNLSSTHEDNCGNQPSFAEQIIKKEAQNTAANAHCNNLNNSICIDNDDEENDVEIIEQSTCKKKRNFMHVEKNFSIRDTLITDTSTNLPSSNVVENNAITLDMVPDCEVLHYEGSMKRRAQPQTIVVSNI